MANEATITKESFYKSLNKLEALAGVGASQQQAPTITPEVATAINEKLSKGEALTEEEQNLVKSQICTGPNSEKREWAGSSWSDVPGNGPGADKIKPDGTDYNERGVRKSIQEKVAKGIPLNASELALLKSDMEKGDGEVVKSDDNDKDDKEQFAREMGKSMASAAQESDTLQKGIEVSEFLAEMYKGIGVGLEGIEARLNANLVQVGQQIFDALHGFASEQGEFNKSLAEGIVNIGHGVAGSIEQVEQVAQQPAGPPRSQQLQVLQGGQQQGFVSKSFNGQQGGEQLSKSVIADALNDMLEKGESGLTPIEIIKFDTTGELRPDLQQRVMARVQGAGR